MFMSLIYSLNNTYSRDINAEIERFTATSKVTKYIKCTECIYTFGFG